jgi:O-antigen biosynthesis protein WbqP
MVFIGPRPIMIENEEIVYKLRNKNGVNELMPGITGWAQVNGRDINSFEKKVELDYYYKKNKSFFLDLKIILLTFKVVLLTRDIKH